MREPGTDTLIRLMETVEDNRKLIAASTPLEVYAALRRRERAGAITASDAVAALEVLRLEAARTVQQPLNPAVLECARQLLDRSALRWPDAVQLAAALVAREMFNGTGSIFVSASPVSAARCRPGRGPAPADQSHDGEGSRRRAGGGGVREQGVLTGCQ